MSMPQFAVATQLYTQEEVQSPAFVSSLRCVFAKQHHHSLLKGDLTRFWSTISTVPFLANLLASDITDPVYRFIHKISTTTLVSRGSGQNKVNQVELFCLMCMVEQRLANVASVLAWSMKRIWRGGPGASIYCGSYVTKLAESLGVFARYEARFMREGPVPCLQASGILTLT
ncbi:hypothetical protein HanHA300_Chr08g0287191 [Helianthus annuus]|nr:hypothetical protein HanHA300_Chr08g0287191 [Helianthus annuus]